MFLNSIGGDYTSLSYTHAHCTNHFGHHPWFPFALRLDYLEYVHHSLSLEAVNYGGNGTERTTVTFCITTEEQRHGERERERERKRDSHN